MFLQTFLAEMDRDDKNSQPMELILSEIKRKNDKIESMTQEINSLTQEVNSLIKTLETSIKLTKTITPQTFVSRLATTPTISSLTQTESPKTELPKTQLSMSERVKYPKEYIEAFEKIAKFYDYKSNNTILRTGKFSKYPRYICKEDADPKIVENLLMFGFIDKIMVDETLKSISKLPSLIVESVNAMMQSYGPGGIYGVQVFDACTDLVGKPILICQIFKYGRNTTIEGDNTSLKTPMPCTIEEFQDWISNKRAIGLSVLKSKIEDLIKGRKACILGSRMGGDVEEILTLYYNNDVLKTDTSDLVAMHDRITGGIYKHAPKTKEIFKDIITGQRRKTIVVLKPSAKEVKGEDCSNPFE